MPRPLSAPSAKKSEIITIRMTKREVEELTRAYGSPGKGLRALMAANRLRPTAYPREQK